MRVVRFADCLEFRYQSNATDAVVLQDLTLFVILVCVRILLLCGLKGLDHVAVNKLVISIIFIVAHTWSMCSAQILVNVVILQYSYF